MSFDPINLESKKNKYQNALKNITNLPAVPFIISQVSGLLQDPDTGAGELSRVISNDQGLVAKILTVANSPLYGIPRRVSTIEFAIVLLGFEHIKNIVVGLSLLELFRTKNNSSFNSKKFWAHSIITASAAKRISDELGYAKSGEAFIAGLLHDLGISVCQRYFNDEFSKIVSLVEKEQIRYLNAEKILLGLTHQEIGQFLADKWNLPMNLGDTILYHHTPGNSQSNRELTAIVHLADYLTQRFMIGSFEWDNGYAFDESVIDILRFPNESSFLNFVEKLEKLYKNHFEFVNL
jgi:HD-like signal output (HDOD) protein